MKIRKSILGGGIALAAVLALGCMALSPKFKLSRSADKDFDAGLANLKALAKKA